MHSVPRTVRQALSSRKQAYLISQFTADRNSMLEEEKGAVRSRQPDREGREASSLDGAVWDYLMQGKQVLPPPSSHGCQSTSQ